MSSTASAISRSDVDPTFEVGAFVVYGSHGIGQVSCRQASGSGRTRRETVVIDFPKGLSVTLPLERACECLRPLSGDAEVALAQDTLRSYEAGDDDSWQNRTRSARSKINTGGLVALAEVVRNAARRDSQAASGGGTARLSARERELYLEARQLLATELALSQGTSEAAADAWIEQQLSGSGELTVTSAL
ncbi:MAG TPA: CarD family transcriptional regulator [Gaiellaceae bacterium]|nr:CarD family transcriptional regulator [Gaiellaceae bacterium]